MAFTTSDFAQYCCELLDSTGPCIAKRMFGGWGISTGGLTLAIVADLRAGETLWLKAALRAAAGMPEKAAKTVKFLKVKTSKRATKPTT